MSPASAPYMAWAKLRPHPAFDLAGSNLLPCTPDDLPGMHEALALYGDNDNGYPPLVEAIAARYGVETRQVATATGTSGANFLVFAALVGGGGEVLVERPGYDPLIAAPRLLGADVLRFDRRFDNGYALDPSAIRAAITPRTRLIVVTNLHNPSGVAASTDALVEVGRIAERSGAHVLVDEVYLDTQFEGAATPAARLGDVFISTSSLTKSYGLAGLRCGWALAAPAVAEQVRRARDVVDGCGAFPAERLAALAFASLDRLAARARAILEPNLSEVAAFLDARSEFEYLRPDGGTVVFPRMRGVADTGPFAERLLADFETAVVPGRFFDAPGHIRLSFGGRLETITGGLARLARALSLIPDP